VADLSAIRTLGFRGEALASIASVSKMRLRTRRALDAEGIELVVEGGEIIARQACAMAPGTQIEVRDLFFNTPARLKFLKTPATEQGAVVEAVQRLALSRPRLALNLDADRRTLLSLTRAVSTLERVRQLFGPHVASLMLPFEAAHAGMRISGLSASTQESFPTPRLLLTFVNARAVRDRALIRAVTQAYQTLIPRGRYPAVALFLDMPADEVDVNVHPMKTEVRFRRAGSVFELVHHALRARLADQTVSSSDSHARSLDTAGLDAAQALSASRPPAPVESPQAPRSNAGIEDEPERPLRLVVNDDAVRPAQVPLGLGSGRGTAGSQSQRQPQPPSVRLGDGGPHRAAAPRYADLPSLARSSPASSRWNPRTG
jgi:DNA mismatch repair protein MutL